MKMEKIEHAISVLVLTIVTALSLSSCSNDDDVSENETLNLSGTKWESGFVYNTPDVSPEYVNISKSQTTLYFLDERRYIEKVRYKDVIDTNTGTSNKEGIHGGTYSVIGTKVHLSPTYGVSGNPFIYKNGVLVVQDWDEYVLEKKGNISTSEKEWAETEYYAFLPEKERYDIIFSYGAKNFVVPRYDANKKSYVADVLLSCDVSAEQKAYERKFSSLRGTFSLQNATFYGNGKRSETIEVAIQSGENAKVALTKAICFNQSSTLKAKYEIYDSQKQKYITLIEITYSFDIKNGLVVENNTDNSSDDDDNKDNNGNDQRNNDSNDDTNNEADEYEASGHWNGHDYVDLGFKPSSIIGGYLGWSTCNLGASKPEETGSFIAWGETTTKSSYTSTNYTFKSYPKVLSNSEDVVNKQWGYSWRLPTIEEIDLLVSNCTFTPAKLNGVAGVKVTSKKNGNSIFLPAAGAFSTQKYDNGKNGYYWTSSICSDNKEKAAAWVFNKEATLNTEYKERYLGFCIRPVCVYKLY